MRFPTWTEMKYPANLDTFEGPEAPMRRFSTVDLDKNLGDVKAVAAREPVIITEHRKDRFVIMAFEDFERLRRGGDTRRVYGPGGTPPTLAELFVDEIDRLLDETSWRRGRLHSHLATFCRPIPNSGYGNAAKAKTRAGKIVRSASPSRCATRAASPISRRCSFQARHPARARPPSKCPSSKSAASACANTSGHG